MVWCGVVWWDVTEQQKAAELKTQLVATPGMSIAVHQPSAPNVAHLIVTTARPVILTSPSLVDFFIFFSVGVHRDHRNESCCCVPRHRGRPCGPATGWTPCHPGNV